MGALRRRELATVVVLAAALLAVVPVALSYPHTYYFYDEWAMITRVAERSPFLTAAFTNFNGHLLLLPYIVYLAQVRWLGLTGHEIVFVAFCASLVGLSLALTVLLRELRVPLVLAVAFGIALTYFGAAPQNMVFEWQLAWNFAACFGFLALALVLRREPTLRTGALAAIALLIGALWDSAVSAPILAMVAVVAAYRWRRPVAMLGVVPAGALIVIWTLAAGAGKSGAGPGSVSDAASFIARLVWFGFGDLVAAGETAGIIAAALVLATLAIRRDRITQRSHAVLAGGIVALAVMLALTTATRAGIVKRDLYDYNRYVQVVAMLVVVTFLPALVDAFRSRSGTITRQLVALAVGAVCLVLVLNLGTERTYRRWFEIFNAEAKSGVAQAAFVLRSGCRSGQPQRDAMPLGFVSPSITVRLLQRLGSQHVALPRGHASSALIRREICGDQGV